jgi:phosphatidylserine/phosphatidylglycerophosphate/cardiolipin synthase-like enzyme
LLHKIAGRGVQVRILLSYLEHAFFIKSNRATDLKAQLEKGAKNITVLIAKHPHTLQGLVPGSYHEKVVIVDGRYAFCGGLEFDMAYSDADPTHKKSKRHDVHSLIEGPVVQQMEAHFVNRWKEVRKGKDPVLSDAARNYDPDKDLHAVQLAITKSTGDSSSFKTLVHGVYDAYQAAIGAASSYVYIEDQYFREKKIVEALIKRLGRQPDLQVIVVLPFRAEEGKDAWGFADHATFVEHECVTQLTARDPKRVGVYSVALKPGKSNEIYTHGKVMIVDDKWITIGSANTNPRSFFLDAEMNIIVRDAGFAAQQRLALWGEHLQPDAVQIKKLDLASAASFVETWNAEATINDKRMKAGKALKGRVLTHHPEPGKKLDVSALLKKMGVGVLGRLFAPDPDKYV